MPLSSRAMPYLPSIILKVIDKNAQCLYIYFRVVYITSWRGLLFIIGGHCAVDGAISEGEDQVEGMRLKIALIPNYHITIT